MVANIWWLALMVLNFQISMASFNEEIGCIGVAIQKDVFDADVLQVSEYHALQKRYANLSSELNGRGWKVCVAQFRNPDDLPAGCFPCTVSLFFVSCNTMRQLISVKSSGHSQYVVPEPCERSTVGARKGQSSFSVAVMPPKSPHTNLGQLLMDCSNRDGLQWRAAWIVYDKEHLNNLSIGIIGAAFRKPKTMLRFFEMTTSSESNFARRQNEAFQLAETIITNSSNRETNLVILCDWNTTLTVIKEVRMRIAPIRTTWILFDFEGGHESRTLELLGTEPTHAILVQSTSPDNDLAAYRSSIKITCEALISSVFNTVNFTVSSALPSKISNRRYNTLGMQRWRNELRCLDWPQGFRVSGFWVDNSNNGGWFGNELWRVGPGFPSNGHHLFPYKNRRLLDHNPPWQILKGNCSNAGSSELNIHTDGVVIRLFRLIREQLRFRINLTCSSLTDVTPFQHWDYQWNEAVQLLLTNQVDIVVASVAINAERSQLVNFSSPFHRETYAILSVRPGERSQVTLALDPFQTQVWLTIGSLLLILGATFRCAGALQCSLGYSQWTGEGFLLAYAILIQQGKCRMAPVLWSSHIILALWLLGAVVISSMYVCNLVAMRTVPGQAARIDTIEQLLQTNETVTWGVLRASPIHFRLNSTIDENLARVRDRLIHHDDFDEEVLGRVRSGSHVLLASKTILLNLIKKQRDLTSTYEFVLGEDLFVDQMALAFRKDFPFSAAIDRALVGIVNAGIVRKWKTNLLPFIEQSLMKPNLPARTDRIGIDIYGIQSALFVLAGGSLLGVGTCIVERILNSRIKTICYQS